MAETRIPLYVTGVATGLISVICYLPDVFMHPMIGAWLDKYGLLGFRYAFIWMLGLLIFATITAVLVRRSAVKAEKKELKEKAA